MRIAVVPARGGSKRIPRKNVRLFDGKPIIAYSIEAALECGLFEHVIISTDAEQMLAAATRFDFILNTIPVSHEIDGYLQLLGRSGRMVIVGALTPMPGFVGASLIWWNRAVGGSAIVGIPETQEMLDFCADRSITSDIELIPIQKINEAYDRMLRSDVKYRFVIDMASL